MTFKDSYGTPVATGDSIVLESDYNGHVTPGQCALLVWNAPKGMYKYAYIEVRRGKTFFTCHDFNGIHKFRKIEGVRPIEFEELTRCCLRYGDQVTEQVA